MARINIEDSLYTERGWFDLLISTKNVDTALGALVRAFTVAQKYWVPEKPKGLTVDEWLKNCRKGIPIEEWKKQRLNDAIIDAKLAVIEGDCVIVSGSEKQFKWLFTKFENGNRGGRPKKESEQNDNLAKPGGLGNKEIKPGGSKNPVFETGSNPLTLTPSLNTTISTTKFPVISEFEFFREDLDVGPHIECVHVDTQRSWLKMYKKPEEILLKLQQMVCDFRERKENLEGEFGLKAGRWLQRGETWKNASKHPTERFNDRFKAKDGEFNDENLIKIMEEK